MRDERPPSAVPMAVVAALIISLGLQLGWHHLQPPPQAMARALPRAPSLPALKTLSLGEEHTLAKLVMLWLQSFDNQPGLSLSFRSLDYFSLIEWLQRVLELDPNSHYPLLAASRIYAEAADPAAQRLMLDFVERSFIDDPNRRWPWLAHAVYVAKHRLGDAQLALRYARTLAEHTSPEQVPSWARQMVIFVLEDMGEIEAAKVLLGGLLESGQIRDAHEQWFLSRRLAELEQRLGGSPPAEPR